MRTHMKTKYLHMKITYYKYFQMWKDHCCYGAGWGGGTLELFRWGCATGTLEPLAYSRASSSEFCFLILHLTPQIPPPILAVFQKQLRSLAQSRQNKTNLIFLYSWVAIPGFPVLVIRLKSSANWPVYIWKMIPSSRPKLSDLYTLSKSKLLESHTLHSSTYLYSLYMAVPPPPPSPPGLWLHDKLYLSQQKENIKWNSLGFSS